VFAQAIETTRLRLRRPVASDAEVIFSSYAQDVEVTRYLVWKPHGDVETTKHFIAECDLRWASASGFPYAITLKKGDGVPIGMIDLRPKAHRVEFGFVLARGHWGNGFMPEAISAVASTCLSMPTVYRLEATCDIENRRSARAMEKAGLTCEGTLRRYIIHPNISPQPRDSCLDLHGFASAWLGH
jgi:ribosomal-protein-alanine N-acetyltransferase